MSINTGFLEAIDKEIEPVFNEVFKSFENLFDGKDLPILFAELDFTSEKFLSSATFPELFVLTLQKFAQEGSKTALDEFMGNFLFNDCWANVMCLFYAEAFTFEQLISIKSVAEQMNSGLLSLLLLAFHLSSVLVVNFSSGETDSFQRVIDELEVIDMAVQCTEEMSEVFCLNLIMNACNVVFPIGLRVPTGIDPFFTALPVNFFLPAASFNTLFTLFHCKDTIAHSSAAVNVLKELLLIIIKLFEKKSNFLEDLWGSSESIYFYCFSNLLALMTVFSRLCPLSCPVPPNGIPPEQSKNVDMYIRMFECYKDHITLMGRIYEFLRVIPDVQMDEIVRRLAVVEKLVPELDHLVIMPLGALGVSSVPFIDFMVVHMIHKVVASHPEALKRIPRQTMLRLAACLHGITNEAYYGEVFEETRKVVMYLDEFSWFRKDVADGVLLSLFYIDGCHGKVQSFSQIMGFAPKQHSEYVLGVILAGLAFDDVPACYGRIKEADFGSKLEQWVTERCKTFTHNAKTTNLYNDLLNKCGTFKME
ncbi:hypothetical protein PCE1_001298 [Barthelona sp. PCE]